MMCECRMIEILVEAVEGILHGRKRLGIKNIPAC